MKTNYFLASGDFYRLLTTFANNLDLDQAKQNVEPDLDPNHLTYLYSQKNFLKMLILKKVSRQRNKKHEKLPSMQRVNGELTV